MFLGGLPISEAMLAWSFAKLDAKLGAVDAVMAALAESARQQVEERVKLSWWDQSETMTIQWLGEAQIPLLTSK